jgi:ABC-type branched-subunit amino acid transport system ATPase component/ABC-type branched-subunit amino acid transport system permease subunit
VNSFFALAAKKSSRASVATSTPAPATATAASPVGVAETGAATRPELNWMHLARVFGPWIAAAIVVYLFVGHSSAFILLITGTAVIYSMSAIGLTWLMGRAGLVSIGNAAIMAVGAYTTAILSPKPFWGAFPVPIIISGVFGALAGLIIGVPALRLRGIYLAIGTLALQYVVAFAGQQYESHTGNVSGIPVTPLSIGGHQFTYGKGFDYLLFGFLALTVLLVRNMFKQGPGRMFNAIHESELAASAIGVNATRWKISAFVGSSALIAVSGALFAYYTQIVSSDAFSLDFAIGFIVMIIIGGTYSIGGAILGAAVVTELPHVLTWLTNTLPSGGGVWLHNHIAYVNEGLYGLLVLVFLLYLPDGIAPSLMRLGRYLIGRVTKRSTAQTGTAQRGVAQSATGESETARPEPAEARSITGPVPDAIAARAGSNGVRPTLEVSDLTVTYRNGARAVDRVSIKVEQGSIVALLGRNGAGKTSTLRAVSGFMTSEQVKLQGHVRVDGKELLGLAPVKASKYAVLVAERDKIFPNLTVGEHLRISRTKGGQSVEGEAFFNRLKDRLDQKAGLLSGGERQLLALAVAWQLRPKLLLVDEFSLGLAPVMIRHIADSIRQLRDEHGMTFLIVEQNAAAALELADWIYVLDGGRVVAEGSPEEIAQTDLLVPASIGSAS